MLKFCMPFLVPTFGGRRNLVSAESCTWNALVVSVMHIEYQGVETWRLSLGHKLWEHVLGHLWGV